MALARFVSQRLRQHAAAAVVIAAATFAGCASASDGSASETAATMEAATLTPNAVGTMLTQAGIECSDIETNEPDPPSAPRSAQARCTVRGHEITITVFATATDVQLAHKQMDSYRSQLASVGYTQLAWSVSGPEDRVWVQVENDDFTPSPTEEDMAILKDIASALGGAIMTFDV